jgi:hypothetical protein
VKKKTSLALALSALLAPLFFSAPVFSAEVPKGAVLAPIRVCTPEIKDNCILSIKAKLPDGKIVVAAPTGRTIQIDWVWGVHSRVLGPIDEWELKGVVFENGNGKFTINSFYFPDGLTFCWTSGECNSKVEQINFYAGPSTFDSQKTPLMLTGNSAKLQCPNNPSDCKMGVSWSFEKDIEFVVSYAFSPLFNPAVTLGRVKGLKVEEVSNLDLYSKRLKQIDVTFKPIKMAHLLYNQPDIYVLDTATHEDDQPAIWIHSTRHSTTGALGTCGFLGGLSIVSNANGIDLPSWNSVTESIEVRVKAAHFLPDGTPQKGYLEVRIPIEMAKCLWGIDLNGEISGKVSISYADSSIPEVLTVTGTVAGKDYLMVSTGYHYSTPTIAIKLGNTTSKVLEETLDKSQATSKVVPEKASLRKYISCKKGIKIKKVTALKPKCPAGYRKVA